MASFEPHLRSLLRIAVGFAFSLHGFQKLFGMFGGKTHAQFFSLIWSAGFLETVGGVLIVLGLFTRCVSFVLAGEMAVAYFRAHAPRGFWPILNGGELAMVYCFVFLWLSSAGAGPWSLDSIIRKRPG